MGKPVADAKSAPPPCPLRNWLVICARVMRVVHSAKFPLKLVEGLVHSQMSTFRYFGGLSEKIFFGIRIDV